MKEDSEAQKENKIISYLRDSPKTRKILGLITVGLLIFLLASIDYSNTSDGVKFKGGGVYFSNAADNCAFGCPNQATNTDSNVSFNSLSVLYLYANIDYMSVGVNRTLVR